MTDYFVRTQYDGKDYLEVFEVYYYDDTGEEVVDDAITNLCGGGVTCGDMGEESLQALQHHCETNLRAHGIPFRSITVESSEE